MSESVRGLRLLSLDGGGIRGLSSLLLLQQLMDRVGPENINKPCDYFDMIGGTSTGGIIAIMLGRLRMSIEECIAAYVELSTEVFQRKHCFPANIKGQLRARFDAQQLEKAIKNIIRAQDENNNEDALLKEPHVSQHPCKVFVCATSGAVSEHTVKLTSYFNPHRSNDLLKTTKIFEAARATSAASTFFEPIKFGPFNEYFVDGATGANNPIRELWTEAGDVWRATGPLDDSVSCIVSIGTGAPALHAFGDSFMQVFSTLKELATETEKTAEKFEQEHYKLLVDHKYFRFNVTKGLEDVGLEETEKLNVIAAATRHYSSSESVSRKMQRCAERLRLEQHPIILPTSLGNLSAPPSLFPRHESTVPSFNAYWASLEEYVRRIPPQTQYAFMEASRIIPNLSACQQPHTSQPEAFTVARVQKTLQAMERFEEIVKPTVVQVDHILHHIRGGVRLSLEYGVKYPAYFHSIASIIELILDHVIFIGIYTLKIFPVSTEVQRLFLNAYSKLCMICCEFQTFFISEFGTPTQVNTHIMWTKGWKSIHGLILHIRSELERDTVSAMDLVMPTLTDVEKIMMERDYVQRQEGIRGNDKQTQRDMVESRRKILYWISDHDDSQIQEETLRNRFANTGAWLLSTIEFQDWLKGDVSSILWCWGNPGVGKTVLCSVVQDYISRYLGEDSTSGIAYVYCTYREPQKPDCYIRSYLRQLIARLPNMPNGVEDRFYELYPSSKVLSLADLEAPEKDDESSSYLNIFTYVIEQFKRIFLVFDALDECENRRSWLMPLFLKLIQRYSKNDCRVQIKIFITSRRHADIDMALQKVPTIAIRANHTKSDIETFVNYEISRRWLEGSLAVIDESLIPKIINTLVSQADGTFLWVKYQLDHICEQMTERGILSALEQLPETLHDHYDRIIIQIGKQGRNLRIIAMKAIQVLSCSARKLYCRELLEAMACNEDSKTFADLDVLPAPERVIQVCHGLVSITPDGTISFVHYSVQEYLVSDHLKSTMDVRLNSFYIDMDVAQVELGALCLTYLCLLGNPGGAFWNYAAAYFPKHLHNLSANNAKLPGLVRNFCQAFSGEMVSFHRVTNHLVAKTPVELAAQLGLEPLFRGVLGLLSPKITQLEAALRLASINGHQHIVKIILETGVHLGAMSPRATSQTLLPRKFSRSRDPKDQGRKIG